MAWLEKIIYVDQTAPYREHAMYAGVVNTTNTPAFIVLQYTATPAEINTALTNYDVVYLEPSATNYAMGTTQIVVPIGKKLIGLGDWYSSNRATLEWTSTPAEGWHIYMNSGHIENFYVYLSGAEHSGAIIVGDGTYINNYVYKIAVVAVTAHDYAAFYGCANEIRGMYITNLDGILWGSRGYAHFAIIEGIYIYNAPTFGIQLTLNSHSVIIRNVIIDGNPVTGTPTTDYGIYCSIDANLYNVTVEDCFFYACDIGIYLNQTGTNFYYFGDISGCNFYACHTGIKIVHSCLYNFTDCVMSTCGHSSNTHAYYFHGSVANTFKGLIAADTVDGAYNFYFDNTEDSTIDGCFARDGDWGFYLTGGFYDNVMSNCVAEICDLRNYYFSYVARCTVTNLNSITSGDVGFYITESNNTVYNGLVDYGSAYGVDVEGDNTGLITISNVNAYNPSSFGLYMSNNTRYRVIVDGVNVYSAGSHGVMIYSTDYSQISNIFSSESVGYGMYIYSCDSTSFSNLSTINGSSYGHVIDSCNYSNFTNLIGRYNRGGDGIYNSTCNYCNFKNLVSYDSSGVGIYTTSATYCTYSSMIAAYDDSVGIYQSGYHLVISDATIYGTGGNGFQLGTFEKGIVKGILSDSCVSVGQYYATPLRSQFANNLAINESTAGYYGYWFGNNGTGYNQFISNNYYNCATGILNTGHARWDYQCYHAFD